MLGLVMKFWDGYIQVKRTIAVGEQAQLIDEHNFDHFESQFGHERAIGYLQAMNDFTAYAEAILGAGYCRDGIPESSHMVRKNLKELVEHNQKFLDLMKKKYRIDFTP